MAAVLGPIAIVATDRERQGTIGPKFDDGQNSLGLVRTQSVMLHRFTALFAAPQQRFYRLDDFQRFPGNDGRPCRNTERA